MSINNVVVEDAVEDFDYKGDLRPAKSSATYHLERNAADGRNIVVYFGFRDDRLVDVSYTLVDSLGKSSQEIYSSKAGERKLPEFLEDTFEEQMEEYLEN